MKRVVFGGGKRSFCPHGEGGGVQCCIGGQDLFVGISKMRMGVRISAFTTAEPHPGYIPTAWTTYAKGTLSVLVSSAVVVLSCAHGRTSGSFADFYNYLRKLDPIQK